MSFLKNANNRSFVSCSLQQFLFEISENEKVLEVELSVKFCHKNLSLNKKLMIFF